MHFARRRGATIMACHRPVGIPSKKGSQKKKSSAMLDNRPFPVTVSCDYFVRFQSHTIGANSEVDADSSADSYLPHDRRPERRPCSSRIQLSLSINPSSVRIVHV
mmetsp:Transcript_26074/g.54405  ORF Transcript_26074/g.54405 Transcript_26074/m.54405 type:complete len:105 (-) Transcript_26074:834-1148(-)